MQYGAQIIKANGTIIDIAASKWSLTNGFNQGFTFNSTEPALRDISYNDSDIFYFQENFAGELYTSPALVFPSRQTNEGQGVGEETVYVAQDLTSHKLSVDGTDKNTYKSKYSDYVMNDLIKGLGITIVNAPHYYMPEYDGHDGKLIDHLADIIQKAGMMYKIGSTGKFICTSMLGGSYSGWGNNWINKVQETYDFAKKITQLKIVKTSKLQTRYEFTYIDTGLKTVQFEGGLKNVTVQDLSNVGFIDVVACYDNPDVTKGNIVSIIIMDFDGNEGINFPPPTSAGPIYSASFLVKLPNNPLLAGQPIDARVVFDGIPANEEYTGLDLTFTVIEDTGERPIRPASQYIDGILIPTKSIATQIKKAMLYDLTKGCRGLNYSGMDPIPFFEPGQIISYPGKSDGRIDTISLSSSGVSCNCYPVVWW